MSDQPVAEVMFEFAARLIGAHEPAIELPAPDRLQRQLLNYRLESLSALDDYLLHLHETGVRKVSREVELALGAYVGETIRRVSPVTLRWAVHAQDRGLPVLMSKGQLRINVFQKPLKLIENGKTESVAYFAQISLQLAAQHDG
jgi:hypothetical protein